MENTIEPSTKSTSSGKAVYILYLVSILFPVAGLVGIVLAYLEQDKAPEWLRTHFRYQIRTFWIGLLYFVIGFALLIIIIGWFILLFNVIWLIIRMIKGLQAIDAKEPIENPTSWMF
ncbi:MAG: hypothetical protein BM565_08390 [Gammaproteobacteria bacterium MedPE]|nr:MAG: hypothetical protein BM565_08390 [Gammaproteobacteria bacterium MedPE]